MDKHRTGQPLTDVTFTNWNLAPQTSDATFTPNVPAEYEGIAILQRAAAVKGAAAPSPAPRRLVLAVEEVEKGRSNEEATEPDADHDLPLS